MFDLTHPSPSPGAFKALPLTASEIDAHPDCDRIWKTIEEVREVARREVEERDVDGESFSDGYTEGQCATADKAILAERDPLVAALRERFGMSLERGAEICDVVAAHFRAQANR